MFCFRVKGLRPQTLLHFRSYCSPAAAAPSLQLLRPAQLCSSYLVELVPASWWPSAEGGSSPSITAVRPEAFPGPSCRVLAASPRHPQRRTDLSEPCGGEPGGRRAGRGSEAEPAARVCQPPFAEGRGALTTGSGPGSAGFTKKILVAASVPDTFSTALSLLLQLHFPPLSLGPQATERNDHLLIRALSA